MTDTIKNTETDLLTNIAKATTLDGKVMTLTCGRNGKRPGGIHSAHATGSPWAKKPSTDRNSVNTITSECKQIPAHRRRSGFRRNTYLKTSCVSKQAIIKRKTLPVSAMPSLRLVSPSLMVPLMGAQQ